MRILQATKLTDAPPAWRDALAGRRVIVDLGAGDGRWVYESARGDAASVYVGVDPDADGLSEYSFRAARKPSRGGVANACYVVASVEQLPQELQGLATLLRVNFPWGSLLRGLIQPQPAVLRALASLAAPGGRFEIVFSYDPAHDTGAFTGDPLPPLDEARIETLVPAYEAAGLHVDAWRRLTQDEALALPSTWGRRLLHARPRSVFMVQGTVTPASYQPAS